MLDFLVEGHIFFICIKFVSKDTVRLAWPHASSYEVVGDYQICRMMEVTICDYLW